MAVKIPTIYKGMYLGNKTPQLAEAILRTREKKVVPELKNYAFDFPTELILRSLEEDRSIREIIREEGLDYTKYLATLRDYQTVGALFMYNSPRSIIADGVGLGKTIQIAALLNLLKAKGELTRFLMATETSAIGQTQVELMRFTGLNVVQLPSEADKMRRAIRKVDWNKVDGIIIKHSALRSDPLSKWLALNIQPDGGCNIFNTFILDESSVIKNQGTKSYTYTKNICRLAKRAYFMNATTFETNIMDIYNQVDMLDESILPLKSKLEKEYCTFTSSKYWVKKDGKPTMMWRRDLAGYKNQEKFKDLLKLIYFGRSKADVGLDRPHEYKVYEIEPTNEQSMALAKGYRYMEVLNCPSLIPDLNIPTDVKHVPKLERLVELVSDNFRSESVMVYCFHNEAQEAIYREMLAIGRKPVILNGKNTDEERFDIQSKFNSGHYDVIITNIQKSLNLNKGDVCIFYSVSTVPSKAFQIAGRIDRNTDDRTKTFVLLLYKGTDEYNFFVNTVKQRAKDSRDLTIDAKSTVDFFIDSMELEE